MTIRLRIPRPTRGQNATADHASAQRHDDMRLSEDGLAARLQQEATTLSLLYRTPASYGYDPQAGFWLYLERYPLPDGCDPAFAPMILMIPRDFPAMAPTTIYLPHELTVSGVLPARFLPAPDITDAPRPGWTACCVPKATWRKGDDLDQLFSAFTAVLHAVASLQCSTCDEPQSVPTRSGALSTSDDPAQVGQD